MTKCKLAQVAEAEQGQIVASNLCIKHWPSARHQQWVWLGGVLVPAVYRYVRLSDWPAAGPRLVQCLGAAAPAKCTRIHPPKEVGTRHYTSLQCHGGLQQVHT